MILRITDSAEDFGLNVYKVSVENFANKLYHPMIATTKWEVVYIDVVDNLPRGFILELIKKARVLPVFDKNNVSLKMLQILCEILPDESARMKSTYMQNKEEFIKLMEQFEEEYWRI